MQLRYRTQKMRNRFWYGEKVKFSLQLIFMPYHVWYPEVKLHAFLKFKITKVVDGQLHGTRALFRGFSWHEDAVLWWGKKCGKAATWSRKVKDNIKTDLKADVHWTVADNDKVQWCSSGRDVECCCHINKTLNLQKLESGIFKSAICQRQTYSVMEQDTSELSKCLTQRDIVRYMDAIFTSNYSFKLPPANKALQKIQYDSHCPYKKREGRCVW
jgi:hypothetical protein